MDATPIPKPPIRRNEISKEALVASMQPIAEIKNNEADKIMTVFRPYLSLSLPAAATPIIQPNKAELTNHPSINKLK